MAKASFYLMDVGMGDCTFIVSPDDKIIMIDFGSTKSRAVVIPPTIDFIVAKLNPRNIIDLLIFTHGDQDHYNQMLKLQAKIPTLAYGEIYYGGTLDDYHVGDFANKFLKPNNAKQIMDAYANLTQSANWSFGGLEFFLIGANFPSADYKYTNEKSLVLWAQYKSQYFILPGDATDYTEKQILAASGKAGTTLKTIYLKLAHHGSNTSSCQAWVDETKPQVITISADNNPGYGLPKKSIINRYQNLGSKSGLNATYVAFNDTSMFPAFQKFTTDNFIIANLIDVYDGTDWQVDFNDNGTSQFKRV